MKRTPPKKEASRPRRGNSRHPRPEDAPLLIEGIHSVLEALEAQVPIEQILVAKDSKPRDSALEALETQAQESAIVISYVDRSVLDRLSDRGVHQGVVARLAPFTFASMVELLQPSLDPETGAPMPRLIVVADHITDVGNLGAIIRSAEAVGAQGLIIPNRRSAPITGAVYKASAGALAHLPIVQVTNVARSLEELKEAGFWIVGAWEGSKTPFWDLDLQGDRVLVLGNEGSGLSALTADHCDFLGALPMRAKIASLNVAQAATSCMYEWLRQNYTQVSHG